MADEMMKAAVVERVTIPKYFYEIIVSDMPDYYNDYNVDFEVKPVAKCPLHGEDTPSLRFYEDTNTYYCWGCRSGGDVIQLHREYMRKCRGEEVSYDNAIKFLYKYFIEHLNVPISKNNNSNKKTEEAVSSDVELSRFSSYLRKLEHAVESDHDLKLESKVKIYSRVDETELLVDLNKLNAIEAMQNVKTFVRNEV